MFVNEPTYSIGDELNFTGSSEIEREPGFEYYYSESSVTISERYTYSASGQTDYVESFNYTSYDEGGLIVTDVSFNTSAYEYDSEDRLTQEATTSYYEKQDEYTTESALTSNYYYASSTGYELDYSTTLAVYTRSDGRVETIEREEDYVYNGTAESRDDYSQVRSVSTTDYETDGIIDYTGYSLQSIEYNDFDDYYNYYTSAGFNSLGIQTFSFISNSRASILDTGYYEVYEQAGAYDQNEDGVVDYEYDSYSIYEHDSSGGIVYYESSYITKQDYDYDGYADRVGITKTSNSQSGGKQIYLDFDNTVEDRGPQLYITIAKDTDGDFSYDTSRSFNISFEAPSALTRMGDHIASIEDTMLTPDNLIA